MFPEVDFIRTLWRTTTGSPLVKVAIVDGLIDTNHHSLSHLAPLVPEYAKCSHPRSDSCTHGTFIASIIFGSHAKGKPFGLAPNCTAVIRPVFQQEKVRARARQSELAQAITSAVNAGAAIVNISASEAVSHLAGDPDLLDAVALCVKRRVLVVAAVGNEGRNCDTLPAGLDEVLAVGAHDRFRAPLQISNWGSRFARHGILALGENVGGALAGSQSGIVHLSGTSAATAIVSGIAALLLSAEIHAGRVPDPLLVRDVLLQTADTYGGTWHPFGRRTLLGRLNVETAFTTLFPRKVTSMTHSSELKGVEMPAQSTAREGTIVPSLDARGGNSMSTIQTHPSAGLIPAACGAEGECQCGKQDSQSTIGLNLSESGLRDVKVLRQVYAGGPRQQLAIAFGRIGFDFDSMARKESLVYNDVPINEPEKFAEHLLDQDNRSDAEDVIWTIIGDNDVPVCAIQPSGTYSDRAYDRLIEFYADQVLGIENDQGARDKDNKAEFVAIPGHLVGTAILANAGIEVPVLRPALKGMANGSLKAVMVAAFTHLIEVKHHRFQVPAEAPHDYVSQLVDDDTELANSLLDAIRERVSGLAVTSSDRAIQFVRYTLAIFFGPIGPSLDFVVESVDATSSQSMPIDRDYQDVRITLIDNTSTTVPTKVVILVLDVTDVLPRFVEVRSVRSVKV